MIVHFPQFYLLVAAVLGYFLPLASAFVVRAHWPAEVAGLLTTAFAMLDGLVAELAHAGTTSADFSWRSWASTAFTAFLVAALARARTWAGSRTDAKLVAVGSKSAA